MSKKSTPVAASIFQHLPPRVRVWLPAGAWMENDGSIIQPGERQVHLPTLDVPKRRHRNNASLTGTFGSPNQITRHWHNVRNLLRERLSRYLRLFELPSADDIRALADQVEHLTQLIDSSHQSLGRQLKSHTRERDHSATTLAQTQHRLDQAKAQATLASLVPPLAHDLGAPVGNANLAANVLRLRLQAFSAKVHQGDLRRSELEEFLSQLDQGLQIIETAGSRIAEITASLKHLSIDQASGRRRLFTLEDLVNDVLTTLHPSLRKASVQVETRLVGAPAMHSYPGFLGQILINLLQNALTHAFSERKGGKIQINADAAAPGWVQLVLSDDGVGMTPRVLQQVFTPFFTTRINEGGSGVGLAYSKRLLETRLGGSINVSSEPQRGTRFVIDIPCDAPDLI